MKILKENELKTCFNSTTKMSLFGDSRTRQIYSSMVSYLTNKTYFLDTKTEHSGKHETEIPGMFQISYEWSNGFEYEKSNNPKYSLLQNFVSSLNNDIAHLKQNERLIGIIGEHVLWKLSHCMHDNCIEGKKVVMIDREENFVKEVFTTPFIEKVLPWIKTTLNQTEMVTIVFLGTHPALANYIASTEVLNSERKVSSEYNRQLREVIEGIGSEQVKFMDAVHEIGMSPRPDQNPLIPDGTHLNVRNRRVDQADSHLAINGILTNTFCGNRLEKTSSEKTEDSEFCCF